MRRYWQEGPPRSIFRGAERSRLLIGVMMLVVLAMLIARAGDPNTWRWLVRDSGKRPAGAPTAVVGGSPNERQDSKGGIANRPGTAKESPPPAPPLPEATGPTDEDPDQVEAAREEFQVLNDGRLKLTAEETLGRYNRVVLWVDHQSFARLRQRARADLLYTNFYDEPEKFRGQIVTLEMTVNRILDAGKTDDGIPLHEVWGYTSESRNRLYVAIVVGLPKGMPIGPTVRETATFAGYFLKLQGYESGVARPGQPREKAPLLIGRLDWEPAAAATTDNTQETKWGSIVLAVIAAAWLLQFLYFRSRRKNAVAPAPRFDTATGEVISVDAWLERSGRDARESENVAQSEAEHIAGTEDVEGHRSTDVPWFPDHDRRG